MTTLFLVTMFYMIIKVNVLINLNPLTANLAKWPNTLKQFVGKLPTNCLSVFGHFAGLAVKGLTPKNFSQDVFLIKDSPTRISASLSLLRIK